MAHEVLFFCIAQSASAADFADDIRSAISERLETAVFGPIEVGDTWVERDIRSSNSDTPISLESHLGGEVVAMESRRVANEPGGDAVTGRNGLLKVTLSGSVVDWDLFGVIWRVAEDRFSGIPYDEIDGFDVSLD